MPHPRRAHQPATKPSAHPEVAQVFVLPHLPHPCGRSIDVHTPVVVGEQGVQVNPLPVVTLTAAPPGGTISGGSVEPTCGTPIVQQIVVKEWKEVNMGELFETNGLSAVLHTFAEKEQNPLMTLRKQCPTGSGPTHTPVANG